LKAISASLATISSTVGGQLHCYNPGLASTKLDALSIAKASGVLKGVLKVISRLTVASICIWIR